MLEWLFSFRGELGRRRFLAGYSLAVFSVLGVVIAAGLVQLAVGRGPPPATEMGLLLVVVGLFLWSLLALSTRRLRHIGVSPAVALSVYLGAGIAEALWSPLRVPGLLAPDTSYAPVTAVTGFVLTVALVLWPGKASLDGSPAERWRGFGPPLALGAALAVALAIGLAFDPWQNPRCPVIGAGRPSEGCSTHGVAGRLYASWLLTRANDLIDRERHTEALADIERVLWVRPESVFAYNSRGNALAQLGDTSGALRAYDRALELRPDYVKARFNRAGLYDKLGQRQRAMADIEAILQRKPNHALALQARAYLQAEPSV